MSKHTPGPWRWFAESHGGVYLATPARGRLIVMDFVRRGMNGAQPRFAVWKGDERENMGGIMRPASELDIFNHPDARLVAAAPMLLDALKILYQAPDDPESLDIARAAIQAAEGKV